MYMYVHVCTCTETLMLDSQHYVISAYSGYGTHRSCYIPVHANRLGLDRGAPSRQNVKRHCPAGASGTNSLPRLPVGLRYLFGIKLSALYYIES